MGATSLNEVAQNVGKYALIEKIGEGHLGPVYRGFDQELGNPVAVRILCDGIRWDSALEEIFNREIRAVAALQHPNIAKILDFGREGQIRYIAMESLGIGTLENLIAQNSSVPVEKKLSIMIQISEGLSHAHRNGILHRDLVPGKIHLTPDGNAKIRDFAVAHVLMKYLPHPIVRWGTPIYLCPEQIQHNECDARSDIFSAGTIFYELITHCHPFHDRDSNKALDNILSDAAIPTFEKFPDAPPGIWTILRTCLAKNPEDRYPNADELSKACRELLVSLAEDTQLVLSELYAALSPLRKAAAQPNAAPGTRGLLSEIQSLLRGEREADYAYLDRLMTILMEQYPAIQAAANAPPPIDSICPQLPPEEPEVPVARASESPTPLPAASTDSASVLAVRASRLPEPQPSETAEAESPLFGNVSEQQEPQASGFEFVTAPVNPEPVSVPEITQPDSEFSEEVPQPAAELPPAPGQPETPAAPVLRYRKIRRPSYRTAVVLLSLLVMTAAGYIVLGTEAAASIRKAWNIYAPYSNSLLQSIDPRNWGPSAARTDPEAKSAVDKDSQNPSDILMVEARALAAENRIEESRVLLRRILETNPSYQPAIAALKELDAPGRNVNRSLEESLSRISVLLNSGKLQPAKAEIDRLQQLYPDAAEIPVLRRRWQALNSKQIEEQKRKEEDQQKSLLRQQKEGEWNRQLSDFLARGKYGEALGVLSLWLAENPASTQAQELNSRVQEIQRQYKIYASAMAENRYPEALNALSSAEKLNPGDPNLSEMKRQADTRRAAARANLTVHRLGPKATLLFDGKPIGKDGELENESVPIGSHTLAIENGGGVIASRVLEYSEGQRVMMVYDLLKQNLRTMADSDRDALAQRRAAEEIQRFSLEHDHGILRGSCQGILSLNSLDVAYSPSSGSHGFRIPFKLLKLKTEGKVANLYYTSDNSRFQTFRFQDSQTADKFRQKWDELKALLR